MRKLASIQQIAEIQPIPEADRIVKVRVKDWWVVTQKENFKVGDSCVYFEIDSFLPVEEPFLFLTKGSSPKKMLVEGKEVEGIRLKTIKLKGQISQGLVLPLTEFLPVFQTFPVGEDLTELLRVLKYEPPMPAELAGKAKGMFPGFLPKTDEERIQNMGGVLGGFYVTEKLDGTSVTFYKKDGVLGVCSRNLELSEGVGTQWKLALEMGLADKLPDNFAIQGELVGEGIQGNKLKIKGQKVYFFNAYNISSGSYLSFENFKQMITGIGLETVPILNENFSLPLTVDEMLKYAEGVSMLNPETEREGVVVRPKVEMLFNGQRLSFKAISNKFLLAE